MIASELSIFVNTKFSVVVIWTTSKAKLANVYSQAWAIFGSYLQSTFTIVIWRRICHLRTMIVGDLPIPPWITVISETHIGTARVHVVKAGANRKQLTSYLETATAVCPLHTKCKLVILRTPFNKEFRGQISSYPAIKQIGERFIRNATCVRSLFMFSFDLDISHSARAAVCSFYPWRGSKGSYLRYSLRCVEFHWRLHNPQKSAAATRRLFEADKFSWNAFVCFLV